MPPISIHNARMARNLDITLLRTFVAVADQRNMTAAGRMLHLTQGAVSQQIARLEELAGTLFSRDRGHLHLTATGERLLGSARRLLVVHDELWMEMRAGMEEGAVRVGVPQDLVGTHLGPILKGYSAAHPEVAVSLLCAASPELLRALERGEIDLALVEETVGSTQGECVAVDRLVWAGAKGGVAYRKRPLPVSMVAQTCAFRPIVLNALRECGMVWRTTFENGSVDATTATVQSDLAVTILLASTVPPSLDILPLDAGLPELPCFAINLYLSRGHSSPATTDLVCHLREGFARYPRTVQSFAAF